MQGSEQEMDSFAACIQTAMVHWGRDVSYEYVAGLSGAAFSPALSAYKTCAARWMECASDSRIAFTGDALGFEVERAPARNADSSRAVASFARRAGEALARRGVALCRKGSRWGVVTAWSGDLSERCATSGDSEESGTATPWVPTYILQPCERSLSRGEALREAIRFGAEVAAGIYEPKGFSYGGRLYDAWLARLNKEHFCPVCGQNGWKCAETTASRARGTQLATAGFLQRARAFLPDVNGEARVEKIADSYSAMAVKLAPYVAGCGLNGIWSNPLKRARYAQDIAEVRHLHHTAALRLLLLACLL